MNAPRAIGLGLVSLALGSALPAHGQALASHVRVEVSGLLGTAALRADPLEAAFDEFTRTGHAPVIHADRSGAFVRFPYGFERPVLRCPRLNACMVALESGETLTDEPLAGDTERWIIDTSVMGSGERTLLVVVKPEDCGLSTNLLVPTDRRVYELSLVSDRCSDRGEPEAFTRQVGFWYPDDMLAAREGTRQREALAAAPLVLNHEYRMSRGSRWRARRFPWIPRAAFDDGVRTHIVLPEQVRNAEMPILYSVDDGERQVVNYAIRGDTLVADRVLRRASLVVGSGRGERTLDIENRSPARPGEGGR